MNNNLNRFVKIQEEEYSKAYNEVKSGYKRGHWMWYIFPQLKDLGTSAASIYYGIKNLQEARDYLSVPVLSNNLYKISKLLLESNSKDILEIFGYIDSLKLQSCMTLFHIASKEDNNGTFKKVLDKFFDGQLDENTIKLLKIYK